MKKDELYDAIRQEWSNMHHNASISGSFPELQNDYESKLFWDVLGDEVSFWIQDLKELVKEKFGYDWDYYSYGRMGATIAPDDIKAASAGNSFAAIRSEAIPDDYNEMYELYNALKFINEYWKNTAENIPEWWKEVKEANEYQSDIDEHEGKKEIQCTKWV